MNARVQPLVVCALSIGPSTGEAAPLLAEAEAGVGRAAAQGAALAVLPELFAWPYFAGDAPARWRHAAQTLDGPTVSWARRTARAHDLSLLYGMALDTGRERPANAAVLTRPDGATLVLAAKMRLPPASPGDSHGEADHFEPGAPQVGVQEIAGVRIAALVCYDRRFPETWRLAAAAGADLVAVLVAGPAPDDPPGFFASELSAHARSNQVFAISAARYGVETCLGGPVRHDGETLGVGPDGAVRAQAGADGIVVLRGVCAQARRFSPLPPH